MGTLKQKWLIHIVVFFTLPLLLATTIPIYRYRDCSEQS